MHFGCVYWKRLFLDFFKSIFQLISMCCSSYHSWTDANFPDKWSWGQCQKYKYNWSFYFLCVISESFSQNVKHCIKRFTSCQLTCAQEPSDSRATSFKAGKLVGRNTRKNLFIDLLPELNTEVKSWRHGANFPRVRYLKSCGWAKWNEDSETCSSQKTEVKKIWRIQSVFLLLHIIFTEYNFYWG